MKLSTRNRSKRTDETEQVDESAQPNETSDAAAQTLEDIDCCLAEVEPPHDDEQAAQEAFDMMWSDFYDGRMSKEQTAERARLLKAQYAHTEYVGRKSCCGCGGCPWDW